ncbi:MAG: TlpA disulfide reductase family protein [Actinomycetota bacterium]
MATHRSAPPVGRTRRRKATSWTLAAVTAAAAIALGVVTAAGGDERAADAPQAPSVAFERFDGSPATLADYRGMPLVVNFWASWCPSCVAEMSAAFRPVQQSLGDRVEFLGMNLQDDRTSALELVEDTGVLFDLAEDLRGDLYTALGGLGMPFTVFISPDGSIAHTHNGPLTEGQLTGLITEHLLP